MPKQRRQGSSYSRNGADSYRGGNNQGWLDIATTPMGVGNSRLAYRCRVRGGCCYGYTEGSYCVFKVFKPADIWSQVDDVSHRDVSMQHRVCALAQGFNNECHPTKHGEQCDIIVRDAALGSFSDNKTLRDQRGSTFRLNRRTNFMLEREIRGAFTKFSSNSGWLSGRDDILEAFSHWSWCHTEGEQLVCDLQGHRGDGSLPHLGHDYYYLLTDPAICSASRSFGESDLGQEGIDAFFANHTCNEWCEHLDIEYERPQYASASIARCKSTSYFSLTGGGGGGGGGSYAYDDDDDDDY